jgi:hypothetical protein
METENFLHVLNEYQHSMLPNGVHLVSSEAFRSSGCSRREYDVFVAGGRFADIDPPGAGLAFARVLPGCLNEALGKGFSQESFSCSLEHGYMKLRYLHHGKDHHDAKCLELLLNVAIEDAPSAKVFSKMRKNSSNSVMRSIMDFWSWFYSKVSPNWHRMCIPSWTEEQLAEQSQREHGIRYRDKMLHPANLLVCSGEPCLHEDMAERLGELNPVNFDAKRYICKAPDVAPVQMDYPFAKQAKKRQNLLIFFPLPADRYTYFKAVLTFYALFGEGGFLGHFLRKQNLKLNPELFATFWPQPLAFIRVCVDKDNVERTKSLIAMAALNFIGLPSAIQIRHIQSVAYEVELKFAGPIEVMRDEWLCGRNPTLLKDYSTVSLSDLEYLVMVYLSESKMGMIQGLPSIPKAMSLFDTI